MAIAISVRQYLNDKGVNYDSIEHRHTSNSSESARASFIPSESLAKGVVLKNQHGYLLTVLPCSHMADLNKIGDLLNQPVSLAQEEEIHALFPDCEDGAIPPIGAAYGMQTIIDKQLDTIDDIYFEAGDHRTLVHLSRPQFMRLMRESPHASICSETAKGYGQAEFIYFGA